jgi:O-antigen/teichoic acid export membrane protein
MLAKKTAIGGILLVGSRLITRLIDLVTLLILAHLLQPNDFGLVAIAMTAIIITEAVLEMPVNQALLRLSAITDAQYDTAFTISLIRGITLATIVVILSVFYAYFYNDFRLIPLMSALSIAPVSRGIISPRMAHFQKNMNFYRDFVIEVSGKAFAFIFAVSIAYFTRSYWAIAVSTIISPVISASISYFLAPHRIKISLSEHKVFSRFVGWLSVAQIIRTVNWQFEQLLLGKLMVPTQLGFYTNANNMANIPVAAMFGPIMRPLLSAFSQLQNDKERLTRSYQIASAAIITIGLPIVVGESLLAEPAIKLLLGAKWLGAVTMLQWLSISLIPSMLAQPTDALFMSVGNTKFSFRRYLLEFCFKIPICLIGGIYFGFYGVIVSRFVAETIAAGYCVFSVSKLLNLSIGKQFFVLWKAFVSVMVMCIPVLLCLKYIPYGFGMLTCAMFSGAAAYVFTILILWVVSGKPAGIETMIMRIGPIAFPHKT